jgi:hypothetical protein
VWALAVIPYGTYHEERSGGSLGESKNKILRPKISTQTAILPTFPYPEHGTEANPFATTTATTTTTTTTTPPIT